MIPSSQIKKNTQKFCRELGISKPILLAPMAGACPPSLSIAVANAGGMGAYGALLSSPEQILHWGESFRNKSDGAFQINLWTRDAVPKRNYKTEEQMRFFLSDWGPTPKDDAGDITLPDLDAQFEAILSVKPRAVSSIMGVFSNKKIERLKSMGIAYIVTVTSLQEAKIAAEAGADVLVAQGAEAGGHRGSFNPDDGKKDAVELSVLVPRLTEVFDIPIIATGGIADANTALSALRLGASAIQIGTGFLRSPEAGIPSAWADAIGQSEPQHTCITRAFSGRYGRSYINDFVLAMEAPDAPKAEPYPIQRGITAAMRGQAKEQNDINRMQAWMGQSANLAKAVPASQIVNEIWTGIN